MKKTLLLLALWGMIALVSCDKDGYNKDDYDKEKFDKEDWDDKEKDGCFELVYPMSYAMPDGSIITGSEEEELWTAIKAWYEAHPDVEVKPSLQYPVDILFEDGTNQTIADEAGMENLKKDCED